MNSFYSSPFDHGSAQNTGRIKPWYVAVCILTGVAVTFWGGIVGRELREESRALATERLVQLGAWIGYTGNGEFAEGKDLTLQRVRLYYVTEQGKQGEAYEYYRDGDTCRLSAYMIERYDERGNCIYRASESESSGGTVQEYFLYRYDPDGRVAQRVCCREDAVVQTVDFRYPDEGVTASVVQNYEDGAFLPENSYGLVTDGDGRELLRISLGTYEPVEEEKTDEPELREIVENREEESAGFVFTFSVEEPAVYRWYSYDQNGRVQYLLEVSGLYVNSPGGGHTDAYLARYEYNERGFLSAEYIYKWQPKPSDGSLELLDDTFMLLDGVTLQRIKRGD